MDIGIIIIGVVIVGALGFLIMKVKSTDTGRMSESVIRLEERLRELSERNVELSKMMDSRLSESTKALQTQYGESAKIVRDVTERLTKLDQTNKQVVDFADQLQNLQDILKNPKQRGVLGEYYLEETLKNVLPPNSYQMQYKFKDGEIVDAVVFVKEKVIPVDSKFTLENYERLLNEKDAGVREQFEKQFKNDLKTRIDETSKYVRPDENTMEFAFMFIPSEAIYYDLLVNKIGAGNVATRDLVEYAFKEKHVIIVSPTSFLAYLQTVLQGLRALQIEESAKEIQKNVEKLGKHLTQYDQYFHKLGNQLGTTVNTYNSAYKELKKVDKDVVKIADTGGKIEPLELQKPEE